MVIKQTQDTNMAGTVVRFYFSSAGYICDLHSSEKLARLQDKERWREYGEIICEELNTRPENAAAIIDAWSAHLEQVTDQS